MTDDIQLQTKLHNGRTLLLGTYWWATMSEYPKNQLFCLHGVNLERKCKWCKEYAEETNT
jgi:hypothetical protein